MTGKMIIPTDVTPEVAEVWAERLIELEQMGIAYPSDIDSWRAYCEAVVLHRNACKIVARSSILIKGRDGGMVKNPAVGIARDSALTLLRFAREFGLTPSARTMIETDQRKGKADDNPFAGTG